MSTLYGTTYSDGTFVPAPNTGESAELTELRNAVKLLREALIPFSDGLN